MDKLTQWVALTVVGVLTVLAAGWFFLVGPKRAAAEELRASAVAQRSMNAKLRTELDILKAQARDLPREQARLARVATKVPETRAMPSLVRALTEAAEKAGVQLDQVSPSPSTPFGGSGGAKAAPDPDGLSVVPVQLMIGGGFYETQRFLDTLENMPRAFKVIEVTMAPGADPNKAAPSGTAVETGNFLKTTITGNVYTATGKPAPVAAPPAAPASNAKAE